MYPIEPPKRIRRKEGRVVQDIPILMYERKEPIHFIANILEMGRQMIGYVDRFLAVASSELGDVCNCRSVQ
jgi:hypothetical protein